MKVSPKKISFTITRTETIRIEVTADNGFSMPKTVKDIIAQDNDIKCNPLGYVDNHNDWEGESVEVSEIEYE
ncbi:MAG: hypothetical protein COA78_21295 [Blastopirellula sp.]|nr:MAG: hypothetical protein COA78_21295 [Blastopirellula sp.]